MKDKNLRKNLFLVVIIIVIALLISILPAPFGDEVLKKIGIIGSLMGLVYAIAEALGRSPEKNSFGIGKNESDRNVEPNKEFIKPPTASDIIRYLNEDSYFKESWNSVLRDYPDGYVPKNPGTILDDVLRFHWNQEKVKKLKGYISFEDLKAALSYFAFKMLERDFDIAELKTYTADNMFEFPESSGFDLDIDYIANFIRAYKLSNDKWLWGVNFAFGIIELPIVIALLPFRWVKNIIVYRILPGEISQAAQKTLRRIEEYFDITAKINRRKSLALLGVAGKAGLINLVGNQFRFTSHYWKEYFAAVYLKRRKVFNIFEMVGYRSNWQRINGNLDPAVVMLCGIVDNSNEILLMCATRDPILAAKCFINANQKVPIEIESLIVESLRMILRDVRDGGESRSMECVEVISLFSPRPIALIQDILHIVRIGAVSTLYGYRLSNILATFGDDALPILLSELEDENADVSFVIRCLGKCGSLQVVPILRHYCGSPLDYISCDAYCALKHLEYEPARSWLLKSEGNKTLDFIKGIFWSLADYGISEVPFMIEILEAYKCDGDNAFIASTEQYLGQSVVPEIIAQLSFYEYSSQVKAVLIDTLGQLKDLRAINVLLQMTNDKSEVVRIHALKALNRIKPDDNRAITAFYASLYDEKIQVIAQGIRLLPIDRFSKVLVGFLENNQREFPNSGFGDKDYGNTLSEIAGRRLCQAESDAIKSAVVDWAEKRLYMDGSTGYHDHERICDVAAEILGDIKDSRADEILTEWRNSKTLMN